MARLNLRRYDVQASVSLYLSAASVVFVMGAAFMLFYRYDPESRTVIYMVGTPRWFLLMACAGLAGLLSLLGLSLGANSAGQRRNDKQKRSWIGFFIGAFVLTMTIILLAIYVVRGEPVG